MIQRTFPAKLLLFGEHVLLMGATALSVPVPAFQGRWQWNHDQIPHDSLEHFARSPEVGAVLGPAQAQFIADVAEGLFFESNVPMGYGLGSSGALCAAVYAQYVEEFSENLPYLKTQLARLECYFHGSSSGIDPLSSYINKPLLICNKTDVEVLSQRTWTDAPLTFLLDSKQMRASGDLVRWFSQQAEQDILFKNMLADDYLPTHESMVRGWLEQDASTFWPALHRFSELQFKYCPKLIPESIHPLWQSSLQASSPFHLKICGAGGGGFILGFALNHDAISELSLHFDVILPF